MTEKTQRIVIWVAVGSLVLISGASFLTVLLM